MGEDTDKGRLVLKQMGTGDGYYLDGKMIRKGAQVEVQDPELGWLSGRFDGNPSSGVAPTLLCNLVNPEDDETSMMRIIDLGSQSILRWPE